MQSSSSLNESARLALSTLITVSSLNSVQRLEPLGALPIVLQFCLMREWS